MHWTRYECGKNLPMTASWRGVCILRTYHTYTVFVSVCCSNAFLNAALQSNFSLELWKVIRKTTLTGLNFDVNKRFGFSIYSFDFLQLFHYLCQRVHMVDRVYCFFLFVLLIKLFIRLSFKEKSKKAKKRRNKTKYQSLLILYNAHWSMVFCEWRFRVRKNRMVRMFIWKLKEKNSMRNSSTKFPRNYSEYNSSTSVIHSKTSNNLDRSFCLGFKTEICFLASSMCMKIHTYNTLMNDRKEWKKIRQI